ncbi:MAG: hypothetical protein K2I91_05890, partial [Muribaculaceae bacterium]|nr:hypothetical protein [Muribaculaceae bacterium]
MRDALTDIRMKCLRHLLCPAMVLTGMVAVMSSCNHTAGGELPEDALIVVGDSVLTRMDIVRRIPQGLSPEDSVAMFNLLVNNWLDNMLLVDVAFDNIDDRERIEQLVNDYRNTLIIESYRRKILETTPTDIKDGDLQAYYKSHSDELVLKRPVIKGLFIKVPSKAGRIKDIRRWMATATPDAIDNLEKYGLDECVKYSFFEDKWMDIRTIEQQIPYRFEDVDMFVSDKPYFETTYSGMTYMLHISDYIPTGEVMPYEVGLPQIRRILESARGEAFGKRIKRELY